LQASCDGANCHGAGSGLGNFAESEEDAKSFIGVEGTVTCGGKGPLIDPDNPSASILVQKVTPTKPCGAQMPLTGDKLTDDQISCLQEWIGGL